jgi:hypothetical protein
LLIEELTEMVGKNSFCQGDSGCCASLTQLASEAPKKKGKTIVIDFLYLDNETCGPCTGTESSIDEAIADVSSVLSSTGVEVVVNRILIENEEMAVNHRFASSPTVRINGRDIALEEEEAICPSCGDIAGEEVTCRVWTWNGENHSSLPKGLLIDAILSSIYGGGADDKADEEASEAEYVLPENIRRFFVGKGCCR